MRLIPNYLNETALTLNRCPWPSQPYNSLVPGVPAAFLNPATSAIPARSHARFVYARSKGQLDMQAAHRLLPATAPAL